MDGTDRPPWFRRFMNHEAPLIDDPSPHSPHLTHRDHLRLRSQEPIDDLFCRIEPSKLCTLNWLSEKCQVSCNRRFAR